MNTITHFIKQDDVQKIRDINSKHDEILRDKDTREKALLHENARLLKALKTCTVEADSWIKEAMFLLKRNDIDRNLPIILAELAKLRQKIRDFEKGKG